VITKTGSIQLSPLDHPKVGEVADYADAMDAADIDYDRIDADEVMRRFPQFTLRKPVDALYQADTGIADAIKGNAAHVAVARLHGATILDRCPVRSIEPNGEGVVVDTEQGTFTGRNLVVTAGAWTQSLLSSLGIELHLTVTQEQVTYYATPHIAEFAVGRFPIFISHADESIYGFPVYGEVATKVGIDASGPAVTPKTRTYEPDLERERRQEVWLEENIPRFLGPKMYTKTCLYTMPKDRSFIIDRLPDHPQVILCVGAGHAYKFAGLFGKILSELAIDGKTDHPIDPFVLDRPAITDPDYPAQFRM
jgi:sarcosine oxidase